MTAKMRIVYITCALLAIAIGSVASDDAVTAKEGNKSASQQTPVTNPHLPPTLSSNGANNADVTTAVPPANVTTPANVTASTNVTTSPVTNPPSVTTALPTAPPKPSSTATTTTKPSTTQKPITTSAIPSSSEKSTTPSVVSSSTTAVPLSTSPPPYKERHFDGLSFLGGIILASCLMAVAAFSLKFYRRCNERNYRTL